MPVPRARAIPLLELVRLADDVASTIRLRIALDVLEPIAASTAKVRLTARRAGSRFDIANVQVGSRGRARVVGRGNRTGLHVLLWEILAGHRASDKRILPLGVLVDDAEPEVAHVVNSAVAGSKELPDARSLFKALVMASAGCVATHREVAKLVATHLVAGDDAAAPKPPKRPPVAASKRPAPIAASKRPAPIAASKRPPPMAASKRPPPIAASKRPAPIAASKHPRPIAASQPPPARRALTDPAAALDAAVGEELSRIAPEGWDAWAIAPPPIPDGGARPRVSPAPRVPVPSVKQLTPPPMPPIEPRAATSAPAAPLAADTRPSAGPRGPKRPALRPPPMAGRNERADVVLVEPDPVTAAHLGGALRRAGYTVELCRDPDAAISSACAMQPRCVVYDDEFLDVAGPAVALRARTNSPRACLSPFIFLTARRGERAPVAKAGARDVWLQKPFSTDELVRRIHAFAGPPTSADSKNSSMLPPAAEVLRGDLAETSIATVLSMLELERRDGVLELSSDGRVATIIFRRGRAGRARLMGRTARACDAIEVALTWTRGSFTFSAAGTPGVGEGWASREMVLRTGH
jgi:CheY-like chemotaxis protein